MTVDPKSRLILALDMDDPKPLITAVGHEIPISKTHAWSDDRLAAALNELKSWGGEDVWADYKLHDTPDTVTKRANKIKGAGAKWITVHASGGRAMVRATKDTGLYTIAVTLLTSLTDEEIRELYEQEPAQVVRKLAVWAFDGGADAMVCSPTQVGALHKWRNNYAACDSWGIKLIVPGTRSRGAAKHDQVQTGTPYDAILNGADYLVVGRQVVEAEDPVAALQAVADEIAPAIETRVNAGTWRF